jgi:hypothetical protein
LEDVSTTNQVISPVNSPTHFAFPPHLRSVDTESTHPLLMSVLKKLTAGLLRQNNASLEVHQSSTCRMKVE